MGKEAFHFLTGNSEFLTYSLLGTVPKVRELRLKIVWVVQKRNSGYWIKDAKAGTTSQEEKRKTTEKIHGCTEGEHRQEK